MAEVDVESRGARSHHRQSLRRRSGADRGLDEAQRRFAYERTEYSFENEQRQEYLQVHPVVCPPGIYAQITWRRRMRPVPNDAERLPYLSIASPRDAPLASSDTERADWSAPQSLSLDQLSLAPSDLEMRGCAKLWPIAFATRFAEFGLAAAFVTCGLACANTVGTGATAARRGAPSLRVRFAGSVRKRDSSFRQPPHCPFQAPRSAST